MISATKRWYPDATRLWLPVIVMLLAVLIAPGILAAKTKVDYWNVGGAQKEYIEHMVEAFNRTSADIVVEHTRLAGSSSDLSQIVAAHVSGSVPDLIYTDRGAIRNLRATGILMDLTPYIEREGWDLRREWVSATLGTVILKDRFYGIPVDALVMTALFRNKAMFADVGLDPEWAPTTIAELEEADRRLTRLGSDGRATQVGFVPWGGVGQHAFIWSLLWGSDWWDPTKNNPFSTDLAIWSCFNGANPGPDAPPA